MFPYAEQHVSSALTGMLNGANPLFATLVAALIAQRLPSRSVAFSLAIGISGTVLMALPAMNEGRSSALGVAMIFAALVSYGIALNIARVWAMAWIVGMMAVAVRLAATAFGGGDRSAT